MLKKKGLLFSLLLSVMSLFLVMSTSVYANSEKTMEEMYLESLTNNHKQKNIEGLLSLKMKNDFHVKHNLSFYKDYIIDNSYKNLYYTDNTSKDIYTVISFKVDVESILKDGNKILNMSDNPNLKEDLVLKTLKAIVNSGKTHENFGEHDIVVYLESFDLSTNKENQITRNTHIYEDVSGELLNFSITKSYMKDDDRRVFTKENFTDIKGMWSEEFILKLKKKGIVSGSNGKYKPQDNVTRAQFAAMLARTIPTISENVKTTKFSDTKGHWAESEINLLNQMGVINGYEDGSFKPNNPITRQQAVLMIDRFLMNITNDTLKDGSKQNTFLDANSISQEALIPVNRIASLDIISGSNGNFNPSGKLNRGQMAKILSNVLELKIK